MDGKCLSKNVVYRAEIITDNNCESYIGLTVQALRKGGGITWHLLKNLKITPAN